MEERDYLKKQVSLLGQVLAKLLSELIGKKGSGGSTSGIEITKQVLNNELNIDFQELINIPKDEIIDFLKIKKQLNDENLEQIVEILILSTGIDSGESIEETDRINLLEKCLKIYEHIEANDKTYSIERNIRIKKIKSLISN